MQILIIEDEKPASDKLIRLLREIESQIEVLNVIQSVEDSVNWLSKNPRPDLILMDIQLEDGLCFEIFDTIKVNVPVIFTTAYDEYSLRAFKVNSVDYLLKPITVEPLKLALQKFKDIHYTEYDNNNITNATNEIQTTFKTRFLVKVGQKFRSIPTADIRYFFVNEKCTFLNTNTNKNYDLDLSLDALQKKTDPIIFFRINRNCLINIDYIDEILSYSSTRLKIKIKNTDDSELFVVSREKVKDFKNWLDR